MTIAPTTNVSPISDNFSRRVRKTFGKIKNARANIAKTQAAPRLSASGGRLGFRDPVTGKIASKAASSAGGGWLSGPKGRRFVAFLSKRFGKTFLARKVMPLLARALAGVAIAAICGAVNR